ncbi:hypothetical protein [Secundilactobacillus similis]|uniref:hypothetical protein n=1 Tax=Secundilactobacillus similis TaxID=414682 RepID=UPI00070F833E|nr:hypothetical protein [Secundilactobacillus similis]
MATDSEQLNAFRQSLKTAYDLTDWFNEVADDDAATARRIQADLRDELRRIEFYGKKLIRHAE